MHTIELKLSRALKPDTGYGQPRKQQHDGAIFDSILEKTTTAGVNGYKYENCMQRGLVAAKTINDVSNHKTNS